MTATLSLLVLLVIAKCAHGGICVMDVPGSFYDWNVFCLTTDPAQPPSLLSLDESYNLLPSFSAWDKHTFWVSNVTKGFCPPGKCAAISHNTTDTIAETSLKCLDCRNDLGSYLCRKSSPCSFDELSQTLSQGEINTVYTDGDKTFWICQIRRTLADSATWCMDVMNGTEVVSIDDLRSLKNVLSTLFMKVYWVTVTLGDVNDGDRGIALATFNNAQTPKTRLATNIWLVRNNLDHNELYASICVKKQPHATAQTTTTSTTKTTPSTTETTPSTTQTTPTTTQTTPSTTQTTPTTTQTTPSTTQTTPTTTQTPTTTPSVQFKQGEGMFVHVSAVDGRMASEQQALQTFSTKRSTECAMYCTRLSECRSYFFDKPKSTCQLNSLTMTLAPSLNDAPTAKYFERRP